MNTHLQREDWQGHMHAGNDVPVTIRASLRGKNSDTVPGLYRNSKLGIWDHLSGESDYSLAKCCEFEEKLKHFGIKIDVERRGRIISFITEFAKAGYVSERVQKAMNFKKKPVAKKAKKTNGNGKPISIGQTVSKKVSKPSIPSNPAEICKTITGNEEMFWTYDGIPLPTFHSVHNLSAGALLRFFDHCGLSMPKDLKQVNVAVILAQNGLLNLTTESQVWNFDKFFRNVGLAFPEKNGKVALEAKEWHKALRKFYDESPEKDVKVLQEKQKKKMVRKSKEGLLKKRQTKFTHKTAILPLAKSKTEDLVVFAEHCGIPLTDEEKKDHKIVLGELGKRCLIQPVADSPLYYLVNFAKSIGAQPFGDMSSQIIWWEAIVTIYNDQSIENDLAVSRDNLCDFDRTLDETMIENLQR